MTPGTPIDSAMARILAPAGLDMGDLSRVLGKLASAGTDLADLFFETKRTRTFWLEDGRVAGGSYQIGQGLGRARREAARLPLPIRRTWGRRRSRRWRRRFGRWTGGRVVRSRCR